MNTEKVFSGKMLKKIKGGYLVKLEGAARVFLPFKHAGINHKQENKLIGKSIDFTIVNAERRRSGLHLVVSRKNVLEKNKQKFMNSIEDGKQLTGTVKSKTSYGYFISLHDGIEGLLHNDNCPRELQVSETITTTVIAFSKDRISLEL